MTTTSYAIRRAADRFHSDHGWLNSHHTFSFAGHDHPDHRGFGPLRVINDDTVAPKMGFGEHAHADMEIISFVISGELAHQDSMGNGRTITQGDFQYMSAGSGVRHSEFNPSATTPVHFLQIWLIPNEKGATPRYEERNVAQLPTSDQLTLVASPQGRDGSIAVRSDASLYFGHLGAGAALKSPDTAARYWLHIISGQLDFAEGEHLSTGDGVAIDGPLPAISTTSEAKFILFAL